MTRVTGKRGKPSRRSRLVDVADACGISVSSASRALSDGKGVRDDVRDRVVKAAKALNYRVPASLADRKVILAASSVAMIDFMRNQFTYYVLEGLKERALAHDVILVNRLIRDRADELAILDEARLDDEIAGCLFLTLNDEELVTLAATCAKPVVLVNADDPSMRLSSVTPCNRSAAFVATSHLIELGHRDIIFLMRHGRRTIERRLEGYRDALRRHQIPWRDDFIMEVDDWLPELGADALTRRLDAKGLDFTAVLAAGDSLAIGAVAGLQARRVGVPEEVSVMGIDDLPQSAFISPPLTTMHIPIREIGACALDLLVEVLSDPKLSTRRLELGCHIVTRQSTGPVRVIAHG